METKSCLAYTPRDIPPELATLALTWHMHLPTDLPWEEGGAAVAKICLALLHTVHFLGIERVVLHPPAGECGGRDALLLGAFARVWESAGRSCADVLLENIRENDLTGLGRCFAENSFGVCLDLGHMLAYRQKTLAAMVRKEEAPVWSHAPRMAHCNAPGSGLPGESRLSAHLPLDMLDAAGRELGEDLCRAVVPEGVLVAEFFDWQYITRSQALLTCWARST